MTARISFTLNVTMDEGQLPTTDEELAKSVVKSIESHWGFYHPSVEYRMEQTSEKTSK